MAWGTVGKILGALATLVALIAAIASFISYIEGLRSEIRGLEAELTSELSTLNSDLQRELSTVQNDLKVEVNRSEASLREAINALRTDLRAGQGALRCITPEDLDAVEQGLTSAVKSTENTMSSSTKELQADVLGVRLGVLTLLDVLKPAVDPQAAYQMEPSTIRRALVDAECHVVRAVPHGAPATCTPARRFREQHNLYLAPRDQ